LVASRNKRMSRMLAPSSIAFIGGNIAAMAIRRALDIGFRGEIWPVNPNLDEVEGYRCYHSLAELPSVPDAAFIGVRRDLTIAAVRTLAEAGAGGCSCYAAGFAEIGDEGLAFQEELIAAANGMPLVGPNSFGIINFVDRSALWPYVFGGTPVDRGVAFISQSGNIAMNLTMNKRSVRFTHIIAAGNQAVLGPGDYVEALLDDDRVSAIGMYVEGFDDVDQFARAAKRAVVKGVPIVIMKVGKTEASAKQSSSHTSSLTGSDVLHDAFFERLGIIRVDTLNQMLETLKVLDLAPQIRGPKIITLSCSGGEASIIADFAPTAGLETPQFSLHQVADLKSQLPDYVSISNPFDYNTSIWGIRPALERCFTTALGGDHDAAFLVYDHPPVDVPEVSQWIDAFEAFIAAQEATGIAAFIVSSLTELMPREIRERALEHGIVPLHGIEDGLHAYAAASHYLKFRDERMSSMTVPRHAEIALNEPASVTTFDEWQSKQRLAAVGLTVPTGLTCSAADAPEAAENIGFPVVAKAVGESFIHKSDVGAVKLNLANRAAVATAVEQIARTAGEHGLDANLFLIEAMVSGTVAEVIVGVKRDEQFGPALVIGSGGILVELVADSVSLLLPTDPEAVRRAILGLSVARLLRGYRGSASADMEALIDAVLAIAAYADANWEVLQELDVNPLMVLGEGQGVVAADALIVHR